MHFVSKLTESSVSIARIYPNWNPAEPRPPIGTIEDFLTAEFFNLNEVIDL